MSLEGKVVFITGAARGLGLCLARDLASQGMNVSALDSRPNEVREAVEHLSTRFPGRHLSLHADVSRESEVQGAVEKTVRELGRIDVLINNAGIRGVSHVAENPPALWDRIQESNLKGQFLCTREVLRQDMLARGRGDLIFISSLAGIRSVPGGCAYSASKWGVRGLAASVAKDLKKTQIRVTTILPGMILTPMARESEVWDRGLDWLDPAHVSRTIVFCLTQDPDTIIPEVRIFHRAQL